jgi:hypothetical protein
MRCTLRPRTPTICTPRGAHLLVTVKGNQPTLHATLKALPWTDVPVGHTATSRGHGRIETRTLRVVTVPAGLGFPRAAQAIQVTRTSGLARLQHSGQRTL